MNEVYITDYIDNPNIEKKILKSKLSNIGLDVLPVENLPFKKSKFIEAWKSNNNHLSSKIIINPHVSYYSQESFKEMRTKASINALRVLNGKKPYYRIN